MKRNFHRILITMEKLSVKWSLGTSNGSSWKTMTHMSGIVNTMVADDLGTQGARASATMVLT